MGHKKLRETKKTKKKKTGQRGEKERSEVPSNRIYVDPLKNFPKYSLE